jgi:tetraacyldisaccharide 4'-kinase
MSGDPLTWIFARIVRARNARYESGRAPIQRLALPVVSVGNLSVGGSGKTPFVQTLGRWLEAQGIAYDVLSRGYKRRSRGALRVDPAGDAEQFGDEPLLLARSLVAEVFVAEDRYLAGLAAEAHAREHGTNTKLHILDDGFQHRQLHREFDIVLLNHADLRGSLLPFGRLREPLSSLDRADAVAAPRDLATLLSAPNAWYVRRRIVLQEPAPSHPLAFCGLARPGQFWQSLEDAGIHPVATYAFGDHHRYTARDAALLQRLAQQHEANGFITTQKDLLSLGQLIGPVVAPELVVEVEDADARFGAMLEAIGLR